MDQKNSRYSRTPKGLNRRRPGGTRPDGNSNGQKRSLPVSAPRSALHTTQRPEDLIKKWDRLKDSYLQTRKKFFEHYHRLEQGPQKSKLDTDYAESLKNLRTFEEFLQKNHRPLWGRIVVQYKADVDYSAEHPIDEFPSVPIPETFEILNIHSTTAQQDRPLFQEDREESVGTMEDYYQFKSSTPRQNS